jgi:5-hydroxyisourate hydrolase
MARLSTHVLDTSLGLPAAGIVIDLYFLSAGERQLLTTSVTNDEGRTDAPLLAGERLDIGVYELVFRVGDYLRRARTTVSDPPFLGDVVVRVGIADSMGDYHVPLLLSPYGYSVYRGS